MAIAVSGGHVNRALDFIGHKDNMYFIIGGTEPWTSTNPDTGLVEVNDNNPTKLVGGEFRLNDIIGLKKIREIAPVVLASADEEVSNPISYRNQTWKRVPMKIETTLSNSVSVGASTITVASIINLVVGTKIRIAGIYEGIIQSISNNVITLDTPAPQYIEQGSSIIAGALVEGAKHVYVDCTLEYDRFPTVTYRQIGLCTGVIPKPSAIDAETLLATGYGDRTTNDFSSIGVLEILDNRIPTNRDNQQREQISLIIEF